MFSLLVFHSNSQNSPVCILYVISETSMILLIDDTIETSMILLIMNLLNFIGTTYQLKFILLSTFTSSCSSCIISFIRFYLIHLSGAHVNVSYQDGLKYQIVDKIVHQYTLHTSTTAHQYTLHTSTTTHQYTLFLQIVFHNTGHTKYVFIYLLTYLPVHTTHQYTQALQCL